MNNVINEIEWNQKYPNVEFKVWDNWRDNLDDVLDEMEDLHFFKLPYKKIEILFTYYN